MGNPQHESTGVSDPPNAVVVSISHERTAIEQICQSIESAMSRHGHGEAARFATRLAWEEAISNAIHHGNKNRADGRIEIAWHVDATRIFIRITDEGAGFDPTAIIDPTLDENLECPSGRGLLLMRAYMTRVEIPEPGNTVRLVLEKPQP